MFKKVLILSAAVGAGHLRATEALEKGCAIKCNNLPTLAYKIDRLVSDENRFKRMKQNALEFGKPTSAEDIVKKLTSL